MKLSTLSTRPFKIETLNLLHLEDLNLTVSNFEKSAQFGCTCFLDANTGSACKGSQYSPDLYLRIRQLHEKLSQIFRFVICAERANISRKEVDHVHSTLEITEKKKYLSNNFT